MALIVNVKTVPVGIKHRRWMIAYAPPRVENKALALQSLFWPGRHECVSREPSKEVWLSCRSLSNLSGGHRLWQKSYPGSSFDLLQRSPYACEYSCLFLRLPPWRDGATELHAAILSNAGLSLSSTPQVRPACFLVGRSGLRSYSSSCPFYRSFISTLDIPDSA